MPVIGLMRMILRMEVNFRVDVNLRVDVNRRMRVHNQMRVRDAKTAPEYTSTVLVHKIKMYFYIHMLVRRYGLAKMELELELQEPSRE